MSEKRRYEVKIYGEGMGPKTIHPPFDQSSPKTITVGKDLMSDHDNRREIFEDQRKKGYWVLSIKELQLEAA